MVNVCLNSYITGNKSSYKSVPTQNGIKNSVSFKSTNQNNIDTVNFRDKKSINLEKLNKLFPDNGFNKIYQEINKDFNIDIPPEIKLVGDDDGVMAGGYTFYKNKITLSLSDLIESDTKIVGIKDGKRTVLTSPKNGLPLFINSKLAPISAYMLTKQGSLGFDKLVVEPVTEEEHKKFIIQKIVHEVIHAQQHMIMRQTEGIGEKEVLKAWTHFKPKTIIDKAIFDYKADEMLKKSYWADKSVEKIYNSDSDMGKKAYKWLEAVRNYPRVDSPEYENNAIEKDAYTRSLQYVSDKYGAY